MQHNSFRSGAPQASSKKRKVSHDSEIENVAPQKKRSLPAQVHNHELNADYYDFSGRTSPCSPYVPTPTGSTVFHSGLAPTASTASPRSFGHQYSASNASQVSLAAPSPHTPAYSPAFTSAKLENSPCLPVTPAPRPASTTSPLKSSAPKLVRTSTIQQTPPGVSSMVMPAATQNFNPYAMYPHQKAELKLNGNLDDMVKDWNPDEFEARRRLVSFWRCQTGSTIKADFKAVSPQDRNQSVPTISCIWWKEKNEYFVTSVDTIFMLEQLVGVRFTVEEKNRIRRNLEGFRPATVSKSKADSEEFFKVIMGFPNPKPRNIEKDVKVFPWKILSGALKKIISKYSASYSSTASALPTPMTSGYASTEASFDYSGTQSPHADLTPTQMPNNRMAATPMNYSFSYSDGQMSAPSTTAHMHMSTMGPNMYAMPVTYTYQQVPHTTQTSMPLGTQFMSAPVMRMPEQYDYTNFMQEHPASMGPMSAPANTYTRGGFESAEFQIPASYRMNGN